MIDNVDVVVVGGGAAGLMCALTAGRRGRSVRVVEHANRVGKKILMSGGGRCNFTNVHATPANFISANPHYCKSALARYKPADFIAMVDAHGIAWHEKELGQLFCDDSARQIVDMLVAECSAAGVRIDTGCAIDSVARDGGDPASGSAGDGNVIDNGAGFIVRTAQGTLRCTSLVVASGGLSIPRMGATGWGFSVARQFGHSVLDTRAGLVPLTLSGTHLERLADLSGVALPVEASSNGASFHNAMLLTHRGLSGPAILQVSSYWEPGDALHIDLLPGIDALDFLRTQQAARPAAELRTVLGEVLPKRFAQRLCETTLSNVLMKQMDHAQVQATARVLAEWPIVASGTEGYRTAEVTLGGVDTRGLSSSTMASTQVPGLYFIGEVVDVTGWLGGYNFQWAWASGHAAGLAA